MKIPVAKLGDVLREAGSLIAGFLIGLSIVVAVFAMMVASPGDWQMLWIFGALIIVSLGITLQVIVTTQPGNRRTTPGTRSVAY